MNAEKFLDLLREVEQAAQAAEAEAEAQDKATDSNSGSVTVEHQFVTRYTEGDLTIIVTAAEDKGVVAIEIDDEEGDGYIFTDEDANKFLSIMQRVMAAITYRG